MPVPRVKTDTKTILSPRSKCGDNWDKNVQVRNPYHGVDRFFQNMLSLADPPLVSQRDDELVSQLGLERGRVRRLGDRQNVLTPGQRRNVETFLERARIYLLDADKIQKQWMHGFATKKFGDVPAIPISSRPSQDVDPEVVKGHGKDAVKWSMLVDASLKNIRCAEEVIRKMQVFKLNQAEWQKAARSERMF